MKFFLALALFAFGFSFVTARADYLPPSAQAEWSKYFPGQAFITDPESDLEKFIVAPVTCQPGMRAMVDLTVKYGQFAFRSKNGASKKIADQIKTILSALEANNDSCFESIAKTYLIASLHIIDPTNVNVGNNITGFKVKGHWLPQNLELTLLGAALVNKRLLDGSSMIQLLTPSRRAKEMSAIWNDHVKNSSEYLVSAGYDCGARQIYIDPMVMPLNLAATFVHELDHLFRDRVNTKLPGIEKPTTIQNDLPLAITMDETLASVMAAYYQRHMRFFHDFKPRLLSAVGGIPGLSGSSSPLPFKIADDLTLFRDTKEAPMNQIWHILEFGTMALPGGKHQVNPTGSYFLFETFLRGDPGYGRHTVNAPMDAVHSIYQTIHRGYFSGSSLSDSELQILDPAEHGLANDPLSSWLSRNRFEFDSNMNSSGWAFQKSEWIREATQSEWDGVVRVGGDNSVKITYTFTRFFEGLDPAIPQILDDPRPSLYCEKYIQGLTSGELDQYIGNKFRLGETGVKPSETGVKPGETGVKPGETGVKPGETGVKPGETGVKPGETGVKPGETGVKPGETGVKPSLVKPCLNIGREL